MLNQIRDELRKWCNVDYRVETGGKHPRVVIEYFGKQRFLTFTTTNTDHRGQKNKIRDLRRVLHDLGAQKVMK